MITHHCDECGEHVEEFCQEHPAATLSSVLNPDGGGLVIGVETAKVLGELAGKGVLQSWGLDSWSAAQIEEMVGDGETVDEELCSVLTDAAVQSMCLQIGSSGPPSVGEAYVDAYVRSAVDSWGEP